MTPLERLLVRVAELPGLRVPGRPLYRRYFSRPYRHGNAYHGVYASHAEALAAAPRSLSNTYDIDAATTMYRGEFEQVRACDYPVVYWLSRLLAEGVRDVFDLGGHLGQAYYGFRRYVDYPPGLRWRVHDVPRVMEAGRRWAAGHDDLGALRFADDAAEADGCDLLVSTGALQYLDYSLPELLGPMARPPGRVIVNLVPMHPERAYFTLQNLGIAICPYRVMCLPAFVDEMAALGYELRDRWELPERHIRVPFERWASIDAYHGMYFARPPA